MQEQETLAGENSGKVGKPSKIPQFYPSKLGSKNSKICIISKSFSTQNFLLAFGQHMSGYKPSEASNCYIIQSK